MEPVAIATLTSSVVSLLVSYLKKSGEAFVSEGGKAAWAATSRLYERVRKVVGGEAGGPLLSLEATPEDADAQAALRFTLKKLVADDQELGAQLTALLKESDEAGADTIFQTNIHGPVEKLTQIGVVHGSVNISG